MWRQNRWCSNVDYGRIEDFVIEYPEMKQIRPGEVTHDPHNYYYRGKKQVLFVYRWPRYLGPQYYPKTRHLFERHIRRAPPQKAQTVLFVVPDARALVKVREV